MSYDPRDDEGTTLTYWDRRRLYRNSTSLCPCDDCNHTIYCPECWEPEPDCTCTN